MSAAALLIAPIDVQGSAGYERALKVLEGLHPEQEVVADRDLFDGRDDWKRRWKEVFDLAGVLYVLPRADMTVGLGIFKQARRASGRGVACYLLDPRDPAGVPPTPRFVARKTGARLPREGGADPGPGYVRIAEGVWVREAGGVREVYRLADGKAAGGSAGESAGVYGGVYGGDAAGRCPGPADGMEGLHLALFGRRPPEGLYDGRRV